MSTRDPYRRPAAPSEPKPRGTVVRLADAPDVIDRAEQERAKARQRAQSARIAAELEQAQRSGDLRARGQGALLLAIGVLLSGLAIHEMHTGGYYHPRSIAFAAGSLLAGAWLALVGSGGAISLRDAPLHVRGGAVVAMVSGLVFGHTHYVDVLASIAGWLAR